MNAISPIYNESTVDCEEVLALDQSEYAPLVTLRIDCQRFGDATFTRWEFTDAEREAIAAGANIVLSVLTFRKQFPPVCLQVVAANEPPSLVHLK